jgi:TolA-binding protein
MKQNTKKLLEQYKNDALSPQDTEGVERNMIQEAIRQADRKKWVARLDEEGIERDIASAPDTIATPKRTVFRRLTPYAIGLAASIAFLVMVVLQPSDSFDSSVHNNRFPVAEVRMGNNNDPVTWKMAMDAYRNNNFTEAYKLIDKLENKTAEQQFYGALSAIYQESPDYRTAASTFRDFVDRNDAVYAEEARWFLAYALFKLQDKDAAKTILQSIINKKGYNYKKAEEILKKEF